MSDSHQSHISTLLQHVFPCYISPEERRRRYLEDCGPHFYDDEIYCIVSNYGLHHALYMASAIFRVQTLGKLADIEFSDEDQQPGDLQRIRAGDIRDVWHDGRSWMGTKNEKALEDYFYGAWQHWLWVKDRMKDGTVDVAMKKMFDWCEEKYSAKSFKV
ncbi:MAG: hypothetical protein Q9174_007449, partial [Haloplaca sp. 1 TL-2023]